MANSIRLVRGEFGHVSILSVASDLVTHAHVEAHVILWLDGAAGDMTVGRETVRLGPRVAAAINSFEPHSHVLSRDGMPGQFLAFYIDPDWVRRRRGLAPGAMLFASPVIPLEAWLHRAAENLLEQIDGMEEIAGYEIERFIDALMDAADTARPGHPVAARMCRTQDFRVRKAIHLMKSNVCSRICFDEIARSVGLSRPHFFALFKEQTNLTPNVYWNTLRMEEAVRQLRGSQEPLISVACALGFTTQGNFTRFFRDHAGVPPTLYRSAARAAA